MLLLLSDPRAFDIEYFDLRALLDADVLPRSRRHVDGRARSGDEELDAVVPGQHGERVSADFVGGVAVGGHAVCAHDHGGDVFRALSRAQERGGHGVGDESAGDAVVDELVPREPGALVVGPCFGVEDLADGVGGMEITDDAEGGAVTGCGKGTGTRSSEK